LALRPFNWDDESSEVRKQRPGVEVKSRLRNIALRVWSRRGVALRAIRRTEISLRLGLRFISTVSRKLTGDELEQHLQGPRNLFLQCRNISGLALEQGLLYGGHYVLLPRPLEHRRYLVLLEYWTQMNIYANSKSVLCFVCFVSPPRMKLVKVRFHLRPNERIAKLKLNWCRTTLESRTELQSIPNHRLSRRSLDEAQKG
jgi:hypothetical protein